MSGQALQVSLSAKIALLRQAVQRNPGAPAWLFELSAALAEAGEERESAAVFRQAFLLDPKSVPWLQGVAEETAPYATRVVRDRMRSLIAHGTIFSPVIAALAIAEAHLGNEEEVRRLVDYDRFFRCGTTAPPEDFRGPGFHSLLAAEIKADLKFYDQPESRSIRKGWRNNGIVGSELPASRALIRLVRDHVDRYIASLPEDADHPFVASRPSEYVLEGWAVVSDGASHHASHIHPRAWLSGVYYVVQPPLSREAGTDRGWLRVGPPAGNGVLAGWGVRRVEPAPGNLVLMPGYFYHDTEPMVTNEERICVAFDAVPAEIAAASPSGDY
jgi:Putative 2OG-Fe(II) oxygenase